MSAYVQLASDLLAAILNKTEPVASSKGRRETCHPATDRAPTARPAATTGRGRAPPIWSDEEILALSLGIDERRRKLPFPTPAVRSTHQPAEPAGQDRFVAETLVALLGGGALPSRAASVDERPSERLDFASTLARCLPAARS